MSLISSSRLSVAALILSLSLVGASYAGALPTKKGSAKWAPISCQAYKWDCLIKASQKCAPAKMTLITTPNLSSQLEIKGMHKDRCVFYEKILKNTLYPSVEGLDKTCRFKKSKLTAMLKRWKAGKISTNDYKDAECKGKLSASTGAQPAEASSGATPVTLKKECPLTVEIVQRVCNIASTIPLRILEKRDGCAVEIEEKAVDLTPGEQRTPAGQLVSYRSEEAGPFAAVYVYKDRGEEEVVGIGEQAKLFPNYPDVADQQCGRRDFGSQLEAMSKKIKFWLSSGGADIEERVFKYKSGDPCPSFIPSGAGCNAEELKALAKEVILPYLEK